jgi:AcrR family transcriptional regulator
MAEILLVSRLSKGGFHHHFSSKDEPLFSEFEQLPDRIADSLAAVAVNVSLSARDRFITIFSMESELLRAVILPIRWKRN